MKITLLHYTPLWVCSKAIRKCWDSGDKSDTYFMEDVACHDGTALIPYGSDGDKMIYQSNILEGTGEADKALIEKIGNKFKHASTLEHLVYNFDIVGVSRALLQELARHRIASPSVKSTRYTLKELKKEASFCNMDGSNIDIKRADKYIVRTGNVNIDYASIQALEEVRRCIKAGASNDIAKYCLPESYKTDLAWTINARSLQNFLSLRTNKAALWEIRDLAYAIFEELPEEHKYLFRDSLYKEQESVTKSIEKALKIEEI